MAEFYVDHCVPISLAPLLRTYSYGARAARDEGLAGATDDEHLLFAALNGCILVTFNRKDFELLHGAWQRWSQAWGVSARHSGIIILDTASDTHLAQELDRFVRARPQLEDEFYRWRARHGWSRRMNSRWLPYP